MPPGQQGTVYLPFSLETGKEDSYKGYTDSLQRAVAGKTALIHSDTAVADLYETDSDEAAGVAKCGSPVARGHLKSRRAT